MPAIFFFVSGPELYFWDAIYWICCGVAEQCSRYAVSSYLGQPGIVVTGAKFQIWPSPARNA